MKTEIVLYCSKLFMVPTGHITGLARSDGAREARFALYRALRTRGHTYNSIGRLLDRDHTTVLSGVRQADKLIATCPEYAAKVDKLVAWQAPYKRQREKT